MQASDVLEAALGNALGTYQENNVIETELYNETSLHEETFKTNVRKYLSLHDEISTRSKELSLLRKTKQELRDYIMHYMKNNNVEQCVSEDGKLYIAHTKSTQPVNKDYIFSVLSTTLGNEPAERLVETLWQNRDVVVKETLRRTKPRL